MSGNHTRQASTVTGIAREIWDSKYRLRIEGRIVDRTIHDTWRRVADALADEEAPASRDAWAQRFHGVLSDFRFLPGGRIFAGAGTGRKVTLFNCFVMGLVEDSMDGIFDALKEGALTMQQGGGIGYDFSTLRPRGSIARSSGCIASGAVSFLHIWDAMCGTILSTGARRGAMMATLRCDHPDIEEFIDAKREPGRLTRFNLSVQVTDDFLNAVRGDRDWPLVFPCDALGQSPESGERVERHWTGRDSPVPCRVLRKTPARALWRRIMRAAYDCAEPGVLFIDRVNHWNNLGYCERITATNPCGEIPLPPYGACNLGSVNLARFVRNPFESAASLDWQALRDAVAVGARLLDNVIDASLFPVPAQAERARATRRIGLGITGLADALAMLGLHYDSGEARRVAGAIMETVCISAYRTSVSLAREKGPFPLLDRNRYLASPFTMQLPDDLRADIANYGIRNSHLTAIAPTGTISLLADNVSSGIEPIYQLEHVRRIRAAGSDRLCEHRLSDHAYALWRRRHRTEQPPHAFVDALQLAPEVHLAMQAAVQPWVDNAVSKTINVAEDYLFEDFMMLYEQAHALGLKGCTTFRPNPVTGQVLTPTGTQPPPGPAHCCGLEREPD